MSLKASNIKVLRSINKETDPEGFSPSRSAICYVNEVSQPYSKENLGGCEMINLLTPTRPVESKLNAMRLSFVVCSGPI